MSEEDKSLFLEAMQDVAPLQQKNRLSEHNPQKQADSRKKLIKSVKRKQRILNQSYHAKSINRQISDNNPKVGAFETLFYSQKGVRQQELSRLKTGDFHLESVLDLHGMTIEQAEQEIDTFIALCYARQQRFIRIIHGKGYNSNDEHPALKNLTNQLLRDTSEVIAFTSTPEKDGGVGAVNILLKAQ